MDGHEIGLALNKRILSTVKTLIRLLGPEISINNVFASASLPQTAKKDDGVYAVYEGKQSNKAVWIGHPRPLLFIFCLFKQTLQS